MMEWTDRHCRYFLRLVSKRAALYRDGDGGRGAPRRPDRFAFHPAEHPVALQIGGSDPASLAEAARIGAEFGYDEINLNVGCPSDRCRRGRFGACLMAEPELVADLIAAMGARTRCR
jgi:tRNA-dihydrouridine synthase A